MTDGWEKMMDDRFHYIMEGSSMCGEYISMPKHPMTSVSDSVRCKKCERNFKIFLKVIERFQDDDICINYPHAVKLIIRNTLEAMM